MKLEKAMCEIRRNRDRSGAVSAVFGVTAVACALLWFGFANNGFGSAGAILSGFGAVLSVVVCYFYALDEEFWKQLEAEMLARYGQEGRQDEWTTR